MSNVKALNMPDIFDEMWRDFDNLFGNISENGAVKSFSPSIYKDIDYPPMNVWVDQDSKNMILEFAMAGIPMENINMNFEGDYLELEVEKTEEDNSSGDYKLIRKGIKSGKTRQRIYIPSSKYSTEDIEASLNDGILSVRVPAREEVKPQRVQIQSGSNAKLE